MDSQILAAIVGASAAIMSGALVGAVSWLASRSTIRAEFRRMQLGLRHIQAQPLQEARLRNYPELYRLLSGAVKEVEVNGAGGFDFESLRAKVDEWDSTHSLLLSVPATRAVYSFRQHLAELCRSRELADSPQIAHRFVAELGKPELALKADLAVLGLDLYNPERMWQSYSDIEAAYDRLAQAGDSR
jgi:hypothetical protein